MVRSRSADDIPIPLREFFGGPYHRSAYAAGLAALLLASLASAQQLAPGRERIEGADTFTTQLRISAGYEVKAFVTRPKNHTGKLPILFMVGWLSCDSVEAPDGPVDGFTQLLFDLAAKSGFATLRINKPGTGGSGGPPCSELDFNAELAAYRDAFDSMEKFDYIDSSRIYMIGFSNGGGVAPLVPRGHPVRAYLVFSGWYKTWLEHMLENERRRLHLNGNPEADINSRMRAFADLYDLYLNHGQTPGQIMKSHPEMKRIWDDAPDHQYGRPSAFYQQLQALNLGEVWQSVQCPTLAVHGEYDWIMSADDYQLLVQAMNRRNPGSAEYVNWPRTDHVLYQHKSPESAFSGSDQQYDLTLSDFVLKWLRAHAN